MASVHVDGFDQLMPIFIGVAEAAALVYATTGGEGRRPSTLGTWRRSLEVCLFRCLLCISDLMHNLTGDPTTSSSDDGMAMTSAVEDQQTLLHRQFCSCCFPVKTACLPCM